MYNSETYAEEKKQKHQELIKKIEEGIKNFKNSEVYKNWLEFHSKFHNYSYNNTILIMLQRPDATLVKGYKGWQELGRYVKKGEKGIKIVAPRPYKYEKQIEVVEPETNEVKIETKTIEGITFTTVTVFDVKQTEGKPIPQLTKELEGNSVNSQKLIEIIKSQSKVSIEFGDTGSDDTKGYYNPKENKIVIKAGMSSDQTVKTLIHEYAHSRLHNPENIRNRDIENEVTRRHMEVEAESIAYIVAQKFGIDTSEYTFAYLASWASQDLKELRESINIITREANNIIIEIEAKMIELEKEVTIAEMAKDYNLDDQKTEEVLNVYRESKVGQDSKPPQESTNNKLVVLTKLKEKAEELGLELIYKKGKDGGWLGRLKGRDYSGEPYDGFKKIAVNSREALMAIDQFAQNLKAPKIMDLER